MERVTGDLHVTGVVDAVAPAGLGIWLRRRRGGSALKLAVTVLAIKAIP